MEGTVATLAESAHVRARQSGYRQAKIRRKFASSGHSGGVQLRNFSLPVGTSRCAIGKLEAFTIPPWRWRREHGHADGPQHEEYGAASAGHFEVARFPFW